MRKLIIIAALVIAFGCRQEGKQHEWHVLYKEAYGGWKSDSAVYFVGNCCPFIDKDDKYKIGDIVEIDSIINNPYIQYQVYKR